ncbi:MAG: penicillin-binding protein 2 [Pseudomonadota bacterium]
MSAAHDRRIRFRIVFIGVVFSFFLTVIGTKAVYLQVVQSRWLTQRATHEYQRSYQISGNRGGIYDTNGNELAISGDAISIAIDPGAVENPSASVAVLARALDLDRAFVTDRIKDPDRSFVWLKRRVSPEEEARVKATDIKGLQYVRERCRYYPKRELAAHVLGFTGLDGTGLEGVEFYYDQILQGDRSKLQVLRDALGRRFDAEKGLAPSRDGGSHLDLTIDQTIQHIAEKELERAVVDSKASAGTVVIMNPRTGAVLAMANFPSFNANSYGDYPSRVWRNRAVTDRFEPGSTMKIFSAAAAIETGGYTPSSAFYCENGAYRIGPNVIHDTKPHGWLTLREIIKYSSNIGAVKLGENIGSQPLHHVLSQFGFGAKTGIDFPGETSGKLLSYKEWTLIDAGAIAFGHGVSVTALQLTAATAAIANGGVLMKPYVVKAIKDSRGRLIQQFSPQPVRQVVSAETAGVVIDMMRAVVESEGTGVKASLIGYTAGGKTGTAQKVNDDGSYANDRFVASFVGFAPASHPAVVILVVIDEPTESHYGGTVAAPAFREMAQSILDYMNVPPDAERDNMIVSMNKEARG